MISCIVNAPLTERVSVLHGKRSNSHVAYSGRISKFYSGLYLRFLASVRRDRTMILLYHRLGIVAYYGIASSKQLRGPAVIALQALGAMVHGTSGRLRKAAVRALGGMKLRKRTETVKSEFEVEPPSEVRSGSGASVREEVYSEEACDSYGRCESGSYAHGESLLLAVALAPPLQHIAVCAVNQGARSPLSCKLSCPTNELHDQMGKLHIHWKWSTYYQ